MIVFTMEHSKEFYESVIRVIEHANDHKGNVGRATGTVLAGAYWTEVGRYLSEEIHAGWFTNGLFQTTRPERLPAVVEDCKHIVETMEQAEYDRNLANEESVCNIKYGRKGFRISIVAIIISGIAILLELAKWIWPQ